MVSAIRPDIDLVIQLYKSVLPDYDCMLRKLESEGKWIRFSPRLHELTVRFKCQHYPLVYQDEARIYTSLFRAIFESDDSIKALLADLISKSPEEQYQGVIEWWPWPNTCPSVGLQVRRQLNSGSGH